MTEPTSSHSDMPVSREGWKRGMDVEQHFTGWHIFRNLMLISGGSVTLLLLLLALFVV